MPVILELGRRSEDQGQTLPLAKSEVGLPGLHSETLTQTKTNKQKPNQIKKQKTYSTK